MPTLGGLRRRGYTPEASWNHVLEIYVSGKDAVLHALPLEGVPMGPPERYDLDYWLACGFD